MKSLNSFILAVAAVVLYATDWTLFFILMSIWLVVALMYFEESFYKRRMYKHDHKKRMG